MGHKAKRKPTAFNIYMRRKVKALQEAGVTGDEENGSKAIFMAAVEEWKKLSDEQRRQFAADFKAEDDNDENADAAELPVAAPVATPSSKVKKEDPASAKDKKRKGNDDQTRASLAKVKREGGPGPAEAKKRKKKMDTTEDS